MVSIPEVVNYTIHGMSEAQRVLFGNIVEDPLSIHRELTITDVVLLAIQSENLFRGFIDRGVLEIRGRTICGRRFDPINSLPLEIQGVVYTHLLVNGTRSQMICTLENLARVKGLKAVSDQVILFWDKVRYKTRMFSVDKAVNFVMQGKTVLVCTNGAGAKAIGHILSWNGRDCVSKDKITLPKELRDIAGAFVISEIRVLSIDRYGFYLVCRNGDVLVLEIKTKFESNKRRKTMAYIEIEEWVLEALAGRTN